MSLSSERLQELTEQVNERMNEFGKPLVLPPLAPGVVRIAYDVIGEWRMESGKAEAKMWQSAYEDGYAAGLYDAAEMASGPLKRSAAETAELEQATEEMDDDPGELADAWPDMPDLTDGVDHFAEYPMSGEPVESEIADRIEKALAVPRKIDVSGAEDAIREMKDELFGGAPNTNGHVPALSAQAAATLGPEHTINTPLDRPVGRARDPLPDPDVARDKLAQAVAAGGNGAVGRLVSTTKPRTLAEVDAELDAQVASVWGDDDTDDPDTDDAPAKRVRDYKQERESRGEYKRPAPAKRGAPKRTVQPDQAQLIAELKRQAMGGVAPSQAFFDSAKPATWGTAGAHCRRLGVSWMDLVREAGLKPSPTGAAAHQPQGTLRAG